MRVLLIILPLLSGCGAVARSDAREDMQRSKIAYKECVSKHSDSKACNAEKISYETDLRTFQALSADSGSGSYSRIEVAH